MTDQPTYPAEFLLYIGIHANDKGVKSYGWMPLGDILNDGHPLGANDHDQRIWWFKHNLLKPSTPGTIIRAEVEHLPDDNVTIHARKYVDTWRNDDDRNVWQLQATTLVTHLAQAAKQKKLANDTAWKDTVTLLRAKYRATPANQRAALLAVILQQIMYGVE